MGLHNFVVSRSDVFVVFHEHIIPHKYFPWLIYSNESEKERTRSMFLFEILLIVFFKKLISENLSNEIVRKKGAK